MPHSGLGNGVRAGRDFGHYAQLDHELNVLEEPAFRTALLALRAQAQSLRVVERAWAGQMAQKIGQAFVGLPDRGPRARVAPVVFARTYEGLVRVATRLRDEARMAERRDVPRLAALAVARAVPQSLTVWRHELPPGPVSREERARIWRRAHAGGHLPGRAGRRLVGDPAQAALAHGRARTGTSLASVVLGVRWTGMGMRSPDTAISYGLTRPDDPVYETLEVPISNALTYEAALTAAHLEGLRAGQLTPSHWAWAVVMVVFNLRRDRCKQLLARGRRDLSPAQPNLVTFGRRWPSSAGPRRLEPRGLRS